MPIGLLIIGATGRMGGRVLSLAAADPDFRLCAAVTEPGHPALGQDAGSVHGGRALGIALSDACEVACDVAVEFSTPDACVRWARWCAARGCPLVSGTTGLSAAQRAELATAARATPILWSPNLSLGANLLMRIAAEVAAALGPDYDIEIVESHHRGKVDAPSGTALALAESIRRARGEDPGVGLVHGRSGRCGPRPSGEIGVHALRMGDVVGEHEVHFAAAGESLRLSHRAASRDTFAAGALRAARWLIGRPAGQYTMADVLAPVGGGGRR